jgi:16S rRNA (cytidine1402-2'-O)-methyltransferase
MSCMDSIITPNLDENLPPALYIVATPIGNLQDISLRALAILKKVNCIAAEDTRHSRVLLQHFDIQTSLFSLHDHNERDKASLLLSKIKEGQSLALISDAGTPLISDPGYYLVRQAYAEGIQVTPIPGACALITALSAAGLPTDRFRFEGFLAPKKQARCQQLMALQKESATLIFYESTHRIVETIADMADVFGADRQVALAHELTKKFESIHRCTLAEMKLWLEVDHQRQKGEFVIVVAGQSEVAKDLITPETQQILTILLDQLPLTQAVKIAAQITGVRKNLLYDWATSQVATL